MNWRGLLVWMVAGIAGGFLMRWFMQMAKMAIQGLGVWVIVALL